MPLSAATIQTKTLYPDAVLPHRKTESSVGFGIFFLTSSVIQPNQLLKIWTGIAAAPLTGVYIQIAPKVAYHLNKSQQKVESLTKIIGGKLLSCCKIIVLSHLFFSRYKYCPTIFWKSWYTTHWGHINFTTLHMRCPWIWEHKPTQIQEFFLHNLSDW